MGTVPGCGMLPAGIELSVSASDSSAASDPQRRFTLDTTVTEADFEAVVSAAALPLAATEGGRGGAGTLLAAAFTAVASAI